MKVYERRRRNLMGIRRLPEDILVANVFMTLPASSVVAVRGVCKSWRSLTTNPSFVRAHTRRHCDGDPTATAAKSLIVQFISSTFSRLSRLDHDTATNQIREIDVAVPIPSEYNQHRRGFPLLACCDGLLCFEARYFKTYHICNPVTKTWTVARCSPTDPTNSFTSFRGLYLHRPTNEYRLLRHFYRGKEFAHKFFETFVSGYEVATVETTCRWKTVYELLCVGGVTGARNRESKLEKVLALDKLCGTHTMTANGNLHWVGTEGLIVAFDTNTERFMEMAIPHECTSPRNRYQDLSLVGTGGKLCIGLKKDMMANIMEIWLMKDYKLQQWTKLHTVVSDTGFIRRPLPPEGEEEEEKIKMFVHWYMDKMFSLYDFERNTFCNLHTPQLEQQEEECLYQVYTESLVTL